MKFKLSKFKGFIVALSLASRLMAKELLYYFQANFLHPIYESNKPLLIRKRAHHLERYLFKPDAYPKEFGESMSLELANYLDDIDDENTQPSQIRWAQKILDEYQDKISEKCFCPLLVNEISRPKSRVDVGNLMMLIRQRRSRRSFLDVPLTDKERRTIVEAALWSPSSCNRQTLKLIFVEDKELKSYISSTIPGGYQFFNDAPCVIVLVSDARDFRFPDDRMVPFLEAGAAIQNIYLACETMGLGCCWGSYTSFGSVRDEIQVRKELKIPPTHLIVGSLAIGKSDQMVCLIPRDDPEERFSINQFS